MDADPPPEAHPSPRKNMDQTGSEVASYPPPPEISWDQTGSVIIPLWTEKHVKKHNLPATLLVGDNRAIKTSFLLSVNIP